MPHFLTKNSSCSSYLQLSENKKPAVFLDRDGVINVEKGYISTLDQVEIFDYAKQCVEAIHQAGYWAIVISNQSGVARGLISEETLLEIHEYIRKQIGVDQIYYCPHYREGLIKKYAYECNCRKPATGMIQQACRDWNIDLANSYMIGDRADDILLGRNAGIKTVLVNSGYGESRLEKCVKPDAVMNDLKEFVETCICRK